MILKPTIFEKLIIIDKSAADVIIKELDHYSQVEEHKVKEVLFELEKGKEMLSKITLDF
jgi:hypothetical protein